MRRLLLFLFLGLTLAVSAEFSEESDGSGQSQKGRFFLYKVKPQNQAQVALLTKQQEVFGEHPSIFLQEVRVRKSVLVLIEESKVKALESLLKANRISHASKGVTLVNSISTSTSFTPVQQSTTTLDMTCECSYDQRSGSCYISKPASPDFKCRCIYKGRDICVGMAYPCKFNPPCESN